MIIPKFAVIPTRNRPIVLFDCLDSIAGQVDHVIIVDNGDVGDQVPGVSLTEHFPFGLTLIIDQEQPVNLSHLWNSGLDHAQRIAAEHGYAEWDVAVLNDDAIVPDGWFTAVSAAMRERKAAAGCSDPNDGNLIEPMMITVPGPVGLSVRMVGWAFMLAGEKGVRANEDLKIWFGDDDIDWKSRLAGGMVMIPGYRVENRFPNGQFTPELHEQSNRDREAFVKHWGIAPW